MPADISRLYKPQDTSTLIVDEEGLEVIERVIAQSDRLTPALLTLLGSMREPGSLSIRKPEILTLINSIRDVADGEPAADSLVTQLNWMRDPTAVKNPAKFAAQAFAEPVPKRGRPPKIPGT